MAEKKENQSLDDLITINTKREEFINMVEDRLTPEEKRDLGENASDKVVESMSYLGVFAPAPATFDKNSFFFTGAGGADLRPKEGDAVWNFLKRTGVLKDESSVNEGRVSISQKFVAMLIDSSNGFLS